LSDVPKLGMQSMWCLHCRGSVKVSVISPVATHSTRSALNSTAVAYVLTALCEAKGCSWTFHRSPQVRRRTATTARLPGYSWTVFQLKIFAVPVNWYLAYRGGGGGGRCKIKLRGAGKYTFCKISNVEPRTPFDRPCPTSSAVCNQYCK
jgi:hypothetical protein